MNRRQRRRRTRRLRVLLLAPLILAAVGYGGGRLLPPVYRTDVRLTLPTSRETVWGVLVDLDAMPHWRPGLAALERLPDEGGAVRWVEVGAGGRVTLERVETAPPERMVVRVVGDSGRRWIYELGSGGAGTEVRIVEERTVARPLGRVLVRLRGAGRQRLERLAASLEARALIPRKQLANRPGR